VNFPQQQRPDIKPSRRELARELKRVTGVAVVLADGVARYSGRTVPEELRTAEALVKDDPDEVSNIIERAEAEAKDLQKIINDVRDDLILLVHELSPEHMEAFGDWLATVLAKIREKAEAATRLDQRMYQTRHDEPKKETDGE